MLKELIYEMILYFSQDPKRVQHFLKVYAFADVISTKEGLDEKTKETLLVAAIVHDIGIKRGEEEFGRSDGKIQEQLGPDDACQLLVKLGFDDDVIDRVCYLIAHHHSYNQISSIDLQILVEADFLVNAYEDEMEPESIRVSYDKIFRTKTGRMICKTLYDIDTI